jgi:hypothetical protein
VKIILTSLLVLSFTFSGSLSLSADEPSPETGGHFLTIDNDTDYVITFPEGITTLRNITNFEYTPTALSKSTFFDFDPLDPRSKNELEFKWKDPITATTFWYWFGTPGPVNEKLVLSSDAWPKGQFITIIFKKNKDNSKPQQETYKGFAQPLWDQDIKEGKRESVRIIWTAVWNENGWKITLVQSKIDTPVFYPAHSDL